MMLRTCGAAALLSVSLSAPALGFADATVLDLLTPDAVVVIDVERMDRMMERVKATPLSNLMDADGFEAALVEMFGFADGAEMRTALGLAADAPLPWPRGGVAVAIYPQVDEEFGLPSPAVQVVMDAGDDADALWGVYARGIDRLREAGEAVEEKTVRGRTVHALPLEDADDDAMDDADDGMDDDGADDEMMMDEEFGDFALPMTGPTHLFIARDGTRMHLATDLDAIEQALGRQDGEGEGLSSRADFLALRDRAGAGDLHAAVLMRDLGALAAGVDPMGITMMLGPMFADLVGRIDGAAMTLRFDGPQGMVEQSMFISMPDGQSGLTALMTSASEPEPLPAFVTRDAIGVGRMNMRMSGIGPVLDRLMEQLPIGMMAGEDPMMDELLELPGRFFSMMGDRMYTVNTLARPVTADSSGTFMAMACAKPQDLDAMLGEVGMMAGLEGEDFAGGRLYRIEMDPAMMGVPGAEAQSMGIGIAGGWMLVGNLRSVESAVRALGDDQAPAMVANENAYRRAMSVIERTPCVAWGFADTGEEIAVQLEVMKTQLGAMAQEMGDVDLDEMIEAATMGMKPEVVRAALGPAVWWMEAKPDGFVMRAVMLAPEI